MDLKQRYEDKLKSDISNYKNFDNILLQIETTNKCNHRCYFCPNKDSKRKKSDIDYNFAKKVIDECAGWLGKNKKICFHMNGEPLLYKRLPELIEYAKLKDYEYVFITTNGSLATDEKLKDIFDAGLDSIKFSINAGTKENYIRIHGRDAFKNVINAVKYSYNYRKESRKNYKIYASCVATKDNFDELLSLDNLLKNYVDECVFYYPCGYAGQNNNLAKNLRCDLSELPIKKVEIKHTKPCSVLWNSINVTCEGYLSLCCSESDNRLIIEDLHNMTVKEAWLGEKMNKVRKLHLAGNLVNTPCLSCIEECDYNEKEMDKDLFDLSINVRSNYEINND